MAVERKQALPRRTAASRKTTRHPKSDASTPKGQLRRQQLIEAAGHLLAQSGPSGVTMRAVAARVGASLSATVYYFADRDELLTEAGRYNIAMWASRAERVAELAEQLPAQPSRETVVDLLLAAMLSRDTPLFGHYLSLLAAGESEPVARAYFTGRGRLNAAVARILAVAQLAIGAELMVAVIDGAAVTALSEGRDLHESARSVVNQLLDLIEKS